MIKTISIILFCIFVFGNLSGQKFREYSKDYKSYIIDELNVGNNELFSSFPNNTASSEGHKSALSIRQRLDSLIECKRNVNGLLIEDLKIEYYYDINGYIISELVYEWSSSENLWSPKYAEYYEYDDNGNCVLDIRSRRDDEIGELVPWNKLEYGYDSNNNRIYRIYSSWMKTDYKWIPNYRQEYEFDSNGNNTSSFYYKWDYINNKFRLHSRYENVYNSLRNLFIYKSFLWLEEEEQWIPLVYSHHIYDNDENRILLTHYRWNSELNEYLESSKIDYEYNISGKITLITRSTWDDIVKQWNAYWKEEFSYDSNGNPVEDIFYDSEEGTKLWHGNIKYEYTYNFAYERSDLVIPAVSFIERPFYYHIENIPDNYTYSKYIDDAWVNENNRVYYYSEIDFSDISEVFELEIRPLPNPATDFILFDFENISASTIVELYDILGSKVLSQYITKNKLIPISQLSSGMYIYKLKCNNKSYSGKILIN